MPTGRLIFGEYGTPESAQSFARSLFLSAVTELVPDVLAMLKTEVLPKYATVCGEIQCYSEPGVIEAKRAEYQERYGRRIVALCDSGEDPADWQTVSTASDVKAEAVLYPELLPLRDALDTWSKTHHLHEPWVQERALRTLAGWQEWPQVFDNLPLEFHGVGGAWLDPVSNAERVFSFEHAGWVPTVTTRRSAEAAIRADFEHKLRDYLDAIETRVVAAGGFTNPNPRPSLEQHLEWLVRYQVCDQNFSQVGRSVHIAARTVTDEVKKAATLVGIDLRQAQRGAPKGPRTT